MPSHLHCMRTVEQSAGDSSQRKRNIKNDNKGMYVVQYSSMYFLIH